MTAKDRDLLLETLALAKEYGPIKHEYIQRKYNVLAKAEKRLNRKRNLLMRVTGQY